ncbi:MAG: nidogen-like domain-containing protein [Microcoleaceae cyanobacterium]
MKCFKIMHRSASIGVSALLGLSVLPNRANALNIVPTFTGFTQTQVDVIEAAANQWSGLFDGHTISIDFQVNNTIAALAETSGWTTDAQGRPTSADIKVRESAYNWTTDAPAAGQIDALRGMMHEIGHAIGWTVGLQNFAANVTTVSGNRFYDLNSNGSFEGAVDFDLLDDPSGGTHAPSNSGDLMQPSPPLGQRFFPTYDHAAVLIDAFDYSIILGDMGGPEDFGELAMGRNDDDSSNRIDLPFEINFFGETNNGLFINNNGNLTFADPLSEFTPEAFPISNQPMIAPFWGDVDTRCGECGEVYVASPNSDTVVVTWDGVGYFPSNNDKINTFQTVLRNRSDTGAGNFDIEFRYGNLQWTTGDASGGTNGLGGTPAQAGFDAGDNVNFLTLPGSRTGAVLNLQNTSNLTRQIPGLWTYSIRNGQLPGASAGNPLLPIVTDDGWQFDFNIGDIEDQVFIDPLVAIGYDFISDVGPNFASVLLPTGIGDNLFDLWLFNDSLNDFVDSGLDLAGGVEFDFDIGGVDQFRIFGIETSAAIDPTDLTAFVTGLRFADTGQVSMRQIPIAINTDVQSTPEPTTTISLLSLAGILLATRKRLDT